MVGTIHRGALAIGRWCYRLFFGDAAPATTYLLDALPLAPNEPHEIRGRGFVEVTRGPNMPPTAPKGASCTANPRPKRATPAKKKSGEKRSTNRGR